MKTRILPALLTFTALAALPEISFAQTPSPPPPGWAGSASAGLAMTQGNSDTSTVNAAYELKHDSGGSVVLKSSGLLVWSKAEETVTSDRLSLDDRIERKLSARTSLFGQSQYLRDKFKSIDHLFAPTVGVSPCGSRFTWRMSALNTARSSGKCSTTLSSECAAPSGTILTRLPPSVISCAPEYVTVGA